MIELGFTGTEYRGFWPCASKIRPVRGVVGGCLPPVWAGGGRMSKSDKAFSTVSSEAYCAGSKSPSYYSPI